VKFTVVGAGSTYTPELVDGIVRLQEQLPVEDLWPDAQILVAP
jgi:6-phospho-beta-glucosidase